MLQEFLLPLPCSPALGRDLFKLPVSKQEQREEPDPKSEGRVNACFKAKKDQSWGEVNISMLIIICLVSFSLLESTIASSVDILLLFYSY